jgi:hypothetical protein
VEQIVSFVLLNNTPFAVYYMVISQIDVIWSELEFVYLLQIFLRAKLNDVEHVIM